MTINSLVSKLGKNKVLIGTYQHLKIGLQFIEEVGIHEIIYFDTE
jgi:hypothetical protein